MEAISKAWELLKSRPNLLLPWLVASGFPLLVWSPVVFFASEPGWNLDEGQLVGLGIVFFLIWSGLWALAAGSTVLAVEAQATGKERKFREILREALARTPSLFLLDLVLLLFIGVTVVLPGLIAYLLFHSVIPLLILSWIGIGIVWGAIVLVRTSMAGTALLVDRMGIVKAISAAWNMAKGRFWSLLGLFILLVLAMSSLLGIIPYLGWIFELAVDTVSNCLYVAAVAFIYVSAGEATFAYERP